VRVLVIGGTGFIGTRVVERLAPEHEVTVLHRGKHTPSLPVSVRRTVGDRDRLADHAEEFRRWPPDVVLDMISGDEHQARAVVDAFQGMARRLVTVSSMDVYRSYEISLGLTTGPLVPMAAAHGVRAGRSAAPLLFVFETHGRPARRHSAHTT